MQTGMFSTERKVVSWHSRYVKINSTKTPANLLYVNITIFHVISNRHKDARRNEFNLCPLTGQITIPAFMQRTVLFSCQGTRFMTIERRCNVVEGLSSLTAPGVEGILLGKPFYVYSLLLTAKLDNLQKFMADTCTSDATACILHAKVDRWWADHFERQRLCSHAMSQFKDQWCWLCSSI